MSWFRRKPRTYVNDDGSTLTLLNPDPISWVRLSADEKASRRWAANNAAAKARGCPCGRPAAHVEVDQSNAGWVPVETWTCDEHAGAVSWSSGPDGRMVPAWPRATRCDDCDHHCATMSSNLTGEVTEYHCRKPGR